MRRTGNLLVASMVVALWAPLGHAAEGDADADEAPAVEDPAKDDVAPKADDAAKTSDAPKADDAAKTGDAPKADDAAPKAAAKTDAAPKAEADASKEDGEPAPAAKQPEVAPLAAPQVAPPQPEVVKEPAPDAGDHRFREVVRYVPRWETGLDAKLTSLFGRKTADYTSPTLMLSAQWNYRFTSGTYVGLSLSGTPQSSSNTDANGVKRDFTAYYGGLNLAQDVFRSGEYRGIVAVVVGKGLAYLRQEDGTPNGNFGYSPFYVVEPSAYFTFYDWSGVDVGAVVALRVVSLDTTDRIKNSDLNSISVGLTFRAHSL